MPVLTANRKSWREQGRSVIASFRDPNRRSIVIFLATIGLYGAWLAASYYVVPDLIRSVYLGKSWPLLNGLIHGQASHPLSIYLATWDKFASRAGLALIAAGLLLVLWTRPEIRSVFWGPDPAPHPPIKNRREQTEPLADGTESRAGWLQNIARRLRSKAAIVMLVAVLPVALLLRLLFLGNKSIWPDEFFSLFTAQSHWPTFWGLMAGPERNMVLYYFLLHFWTRLGDSPAFVRGLSVLFALATIPVVYALGSRVFGPKVGLFAASLLAINGFHIEYSQDARAYSLLVLLASLSSLFFLKSIENPTRSNWTKYIGTSSLAIYSHLFGVLVITAQWFSLLFLPRRWVPWRRLIASTVAIGLLSLPMGLLALTPSSKQLGWVLKPTVRGVYDLFFRLAGYSEFVPRHHPEAILPIAMLVLAVIAIVAGWKHWRSKEHVDTWHLGLLVSWLCVPVVLTFLVSLKEPVFVDRFLIICLPPLILLAAFGLSRIRRNWIAVPILLLIVGTTSRGLVWYYRSPGFANWKSAVHLVLSTAKPGDAVLIYPEYISYPWPNRRVFQYYATSPAGSGDIPVSSLAFLGSVPSPGFRQWLKQLPSHYKQIWLVREPGPPGPADAKQEPEAEAALAAEYPHVRSTAFAGVIVDMYGK